MPWHEGISHIGSTNNYVGQQIIVTARNGSYYYVKNLGWIDKRAFNVELQQAVDNTKDSNLSTNTKRTTTEIEKQATVLGAGKSIDSLPWGTEGYCKIGNLDNFSGKTIKLTQESESYVYSPDVKGWIDKKGLNY